MTTRTYRGRSLEELLPKVRAELGPDAVIIRQREGLTGGIAGFFQRKLVEIEAAAPGEAGALGAGDAGAFGPGGAAPLGPGVDVRDDSPAAPDFLGELTRAQAAASTTEPFVPLELGEVVDDDAWSEWRDPAPAPAVGPFVTDQVTELPEPGRALAAWGGPAAARIELATPPAAPVPAAPVALEPAVPEPAARLPVPARAAPLPERWPDEAAELRDALVARGVEAPLADEVIEETVTHLVPLRTTARLKPLLVSALARRIPVAPLGALTGRVVAFVGPGGAGKTNCTARLAGAYAAAQRTPVACVTLGARDGGAELALLLAATGVPLHPAAGGAEAADRIAPVREQSLVLVDTPSVSPRAKADLRALHGELRALGADDVLLTIPATTSAGAAREIVAAGKKVGASGVVLTHADETEHFGPAIGVAMESGLPFAYVGEERALRPAAAEELAGALVGASRGGSARR